MNVISSRSASVDASQSTTIGKQDEKGIDFYTESPNKELSLDEFEIYALKRLRVLRKIEQLRLLRNLTPEQLNLQIEQRVKQEDLNNPDIDTTSHYILRLSYCQTEELRRWFLQQEGFLFQHRLHHQFTSAQIAHAVQSYCDLQPISVEQKEALRQPLMQLMTSPTEFATTTFYAVPFTQALDLVSSRSCYIRHGLAYVPQPRVVSVLVGHFRTHLSHQLSLMGAAGTLTAPDDPEATRVYPLLKNLHQCLAQRDTTEETYSAGQLTATNVAAFKNNMPLCMRQLQTGLEHDKKLKHGGRLQYGLFLKAAGLSLNDALTFFERHFTLVTNEQFQKQYAYSIRHMYGQEGRRKEYTPYGCLKIIMGSAPSSGDHHGCPYKHYDASYLSNVLSKLQIGTPADRKAILDLQASQQYQIACLRQFQVQHPKAETMSTEVSRLTNNVGNHPNAWFMASVKYHEFVKRNVETSPNETMNDVLT